MKIADPNSKRSKRRRNRNNDSNFKIKSYMGSRPNRRAEKRLASAMGAYKGQDHECKPGSLNHW